MLVATFTIANLKSMSFDRIMGPPWTVEAVVLAKPATKQSVMPVTMDMKWKLLSDLRLADLEFGVPGHIDIHLGVDVFN